MTALTTDARKVITDALAAAGLPAFAYVPATVSLPAVIITPRDPYITPDRVGAILTYTAAFRVSCIVQALDNETALAACELLIDRTITALPDGVRFIRGGPPLMDDLGGQGTAFVAELDVEAHVTGTAPPPGGVPPFERGVFVYSSAAVPPPPPGCFAVARVGDAMDMAISVRDNDGIAHNMNIAPGSEVAATDTVTGGSFTGTVSTVTDHGNYFVWSLTVTGESGTTGPGDLVSVTAFPPAAARKRNKPAPTPTR
jgi:hypothetical protein